MITKNISRFGRDSVEVLEGLNKLRVLGVRVIFELEGLDRADTDGVMIIKEDVAKNVRIIFELYMRGFSIIGIKRELEKRGIKTPTGKENWSKRTIDVMLSNEKYIGVVRLLNVGEHQDIMFQKITIQQLFQKNNLKRYKRKRKIEVML